VNKPLRKIMAIALALAVGTLVTAQRAAAADLKPALTIAFAGYDQLISNLKALDELSPNAKLADKAKAALEAQTQGKGLAGLDKSRPWGVLVTLSENDQPVVQGYLPTTDLKKLLAALPLPGGEPSANDKGVFELPAGEKTIYAKQKGQWAVFSYGEDSLGSAPDDPLPALSDLTKKYTLSLRGSVQNIPAAARENAIKSLRGIVEFTLAMQPSNSEEQRAIMTANVKQIFDKLEKLSKEIDTLVLGVGLDASSKALFWDFEARGVDGSDLAKSFAALQDAKTDFGGFALPGAAMTLLSAHANSDAEVADLKATLPTYKAAADKVLDSNEELSKEKRELGKEVVNEVLGVLEKSVELKKSDCGMALLLDDSPAAVFGVRIADGMKLDEAFKKLAKALADEDSKPAEFLKLFKFDVEKYEGVGFHVAKLPPGNAKVADVFGNPVQIVVGINESNLYMGVGKDPIAVIKKAIDASKAAPGKAIDPVDMVISATPIAKFLAKAAPGAEAKKSLAKAAESLAKSGGKEHLTLTVKPIPNGMNLRVNVESGITKAILDASGDADE